MTCPECELNKARAALWRHEAYKHAGTVLPWNVDEAIAKAVAAEREACAKVCDKRADEDGWEGSYAHQCAAAIRSRT